MLEMCHFLYFGSLVCKNFPKIDKIRVSDGLKKYFQLRAEYSDIFNLEHLKWPMDVRRPFLLRQNDVSGF